MTRSQNHYDFKLGRDLTWGTAAVKSAPNVVLKLPHYFVRIVKYNYNTSLLRT